MSAAKPLVLVCITVLVLAASSVCAEDAPAKRKPNEARIKGMKVAIDDIEKGILKEKHQPYPDSPQMIEYYGTLKKIGVTIEIVDKSDKATMDEMEGYNDVMRVEIEHHHGRGILDSLRKAAEKAVERPKQPATPPKAG
jgi:soluble cytochrome b562